MGRIPPIEHSSSDEPRNLWKRRAACAEINRRRVNEALDRGRDRRGVAPFVCECGRTGCNTHVELGADQYESVRSSFERFVVVTGHELDGLDTRRLRRGSARRRLLVVPRSSAVKC